MAGLINTGIWGFISSAKATGKKIMNAAGEEIDEWVSTFVSGASGWLIDKLGNAEFKSVFVRDKFITNEFVYNRIKVTEDEEIISSSVKIASYIDNEDGTFTVYPDLREGDYNPLAEDDLVMGYYHNPGNSGVIYAVQKFKAISDPSKDGQSIILEPEGDSIPYQHMIIVRVGNITDEERQSFIRISSKTNCQYFYDGIDGWDTYIDPDHVKCVLGHADMGLIPAWAREAVSGVKRWFGLIADGVIIRGTFILHNDKTIEDELNGREIQLRGDFQIREDGITGKWQEVIEYTKKASDAATTAGTYMKKTEELSGEFNVNYEKLSGEFKSKVDEEVKDSLGTITKAKDEATSSLQLTARDFVLEFTDVLDKQTVYATGAIDDVKRTAESSLKMTADDLVLAFNEHVETKTDEANGEISETTEYAKSQIKLSADALSVSFEKELNEKVKKADGAITDVKNKATSDLQLTADKLKLDFTDILDEKTIGANGEITDTKNLAKSELSRTAKELTDKFTEAVTDAEGDIIKEISTQVSQNAKEWKVEVMGTDKDGNPNSILAAINASEDGIKIKGNKIEIDGNLIVDAIMSTGINIDDVFVVKVENGKAKVSIKGDGIFTGALKTPFRVFSSYDEVIMSPDKSTGFNYTYVAKAENVNVLTVSNIMDEKFNGASMNIYVSGEPGQSLELRSSLKYPSAFILPGDRSDGKTRDFDMVRIKVGGYLELQAIATTKGDAQTNRTFWVIKNYDSSTMTLLNWA